MSEKKEEKDNQETKESEDEKEEEEEEINGIFCPNLSPLTKKIGYYITFLAGFVVFLVGLIDIFTGSVVPLIIGSVLILFSPLWIKSPKSMCYDFKNSQRLPSFLLYLLFLIATFLEIILLDSFLIRIILGVCLGITGIWYFLSFFKNGQKAFLSCLKTCCCGDKQEESEGETVESSEEKS